MTGTVFRHYWRPWLWDKPLAAEKVLLRSVNDSGAGNWRVLSPILSESLKLHTEFGSLVPLRGASGQSSSTGRDSWL